MKTLSRVYTGLIFAFLYLPLVIMVVFSFNSSRSQMVFTGFTLEWYQKLFSNKLIMDALFVTLTVALIATFFATIIGTAAAVGIHNMNRKLRRVMMTVNNIPMVNPEIVTGVSMMLLYALFIGFLRSFMPADKAPGLGYGTLLIAHITFCIPYVLLQVLPKLRQMNKHMYEAALDLGCRPLAAFFKVVLPEILPGVITGALMAFTISLDDFVISLFTTGPSAQNLSITIYSMVRRRVSPEVNALTSLMFGAVFILLILVNVLQIRDQNKRRA